MSTTKEAQDNDLAYLRLLHLADSALPVGALAHSFGLESLTASGLLTPGGVPELLRAYTQEAGVMEAVFCREAFRLASTEPKALRDHRWIEINQRLSALKPARESRAGSAALGLHFMTAVLGLGEFPRVREALAAARQAQTMVHHGPTFGLVAGVLGLDEDHSVLAYLHQSLASLVSACQRLMPIGQSEATRILWNLKPALIEAAKRSRAYSIDDVSSFTPLLDWAAMEHPALETRLFIS